MQSLTLFLESLGRVDSINAACLTSSDSLPLSIALHATETLPQDLSQGVHILRNLGQCIDRSGLPAWISMVCHDDVHLEVATDTHQSIVSVLDTGTDGCPVQEEAEYLETNPLSTPIGHELGTKGLATGGLGDKHGFKYTCDV